MNAEPGKEAEHVVTDRPLHNFLFDTDPHGFYRGLECYSTPWIDVCVLVHLVRRYEAVRFDAMFDATIDGLRTCAAASSLAIGSSTGPTWALLFSDISQIVLESRRSPHAYWNFDRCQTVLTKRLTILPTLNCLIPKVA